jgi:predicted secreted protein
MRAHRIAAGLKGAVGAALVAFGCISAAVPAQAGDVANLEILGFSADGGIFAFEEHGVFDGSGTAYANRFYIDTQSDEFVGGSPIRAEVEDAIGAPAAARAEAKRRGEKIVSDAELEAHSGWLAGYNPLTELSADPKRIVVQPHPYFIMTESPLEFRLEEIAFAEPTGCENMGDVIGFRILRVDPVPGGVTKVIHEDKSIPASRFCPLGYRIGAVQVYGEGPGEPFAILIAFSRMGFEGPDYRWIALTGRL